MSNDSCPLPLVSDALKANLRETAAPAVINPAYELLRDVVSRFQGILGKLDALLYEIGHPYRNWKLIIPELRAYVLKNCNHYRDHEQGPEAFSLFMSIFFDALKDSSRNDWLLQRILEAMLAYADKLILTMDSPTLFRFEGAFSEFFSRLADLDEREPQVMLSMVQGHHPVRKMAQKVIALRRQQPEITYDVQALSLLMRAILVRNYEYWLSEDDPLPWFEKKCGEYCHKWKGKTLLQGISHARIQECLQMLASIDFESDYQGALEKILTLPNHMDLVRLYKEIPSKMVVVESFDDQTAHFIENRKLLFLFRTMETKGLTLIHEETLREINRSLVQLIRKQSFEEIEQFFVTTFHLLKANVRRYPHTSLQCIQVIGNEVFKRGNSRLVEAFLWETVRFGFQYASVRGVDEDWQPIANPAHLTNIRVWLHLIAQEPKWCSTLFSALIINLHLSGTCVRDTDLFQRDITDLLNHPIGPIYNLAKQFTKLMPVFFNEIGAEGELRDVSTELDEIHKRKDVLIHFLRKQSHVESSNLIVGFIEAIFTFWITLDKAYLRDYLPEEVLQQVQTTGPFVDDQHQLAGRIKQELRFNRMVQILDWPENERQEFLDRQTDLSEVERRRFSLLVRMYKLLHQKYNLSLPEIHLQLRHAIGNGFPELAKLLEVLEEDDPIRCLEALFDELEHLQGVILSPEKFEPKEEIYYKRHIAVDIPSVYGRYSERKFDALGLTFRLESLANIYLEKLFATVNLNFITQATFIRILKCLRLFSRALQVDGISSRRLDTYISLLATSIGIRRFSYTQHLDIMRGLSEGVKDIIYAYYTNIHQNNLSIIVPQLGKDNLLIKYHSSWNEKNMPETVLRISEMFFRDLISTTFGLQHLDNFIGQVIATLEAQKDILDESTLDLLMTYNPKKAISSLHDENLRTHDLIHLGNKGFNLVLLTRDKMPVPPAFTITTEVFRCYRAIRKFDRARDEYMRRVRAAVTGLEQLTGRVFGSPDRPLLLSVRSGAAISMPGVMSTIHNVGANVDLLEEFVVKHPAANYFAWDNFRRFQQSWGMANGMEREDFQELMNVHKERHDIHYKRDFTPEQMRELALDYRQAVLSRGVGIPEDPWEQLVGAVDMVFDSWHTPKAEEYRHLMGVSDDWGTAVIVQSMVFGNVSLQAGSGVLFTAHPYRKVRRVALWGDYAIGDQGEDIVSGLVTSHPISVEQAELDGRDENKSLELRFPQIYKRLLEISRELVYDKEWNPQEIEFTFEGPEADQLYMLQTRDMITIKKKEHLTVFVDSDLAHKSILAKGIGVSGSAMSGKAVFTERNINLLRKQEPDTHLILIRRDTVPEDIREISLADGLVTSRGGQTSHASVMATRLEKTCVVGCRDMQVNETEEYADINGTRITFGTPIAIDGRHGLLIEGNYPLREEVHILPL
ncbi:phosphoenolpyruvate synthase [Desulfobulbus rhabdoformis]|uniref:PEP/pyruvate-binding domain-containing protein n=1 Tax=Desulfobulbus rhabdoformis TaxID=34032 RepID=UPI0019669CB9|nr:PEP/pyruvate-binding domain-containing protein [Desulfobulbus rhabdoformis]MBM9616291.1 phosphoenolpyruvate synthase [Desulfobulbus rhabdoformis]